MAAPALADVGIVAPAEEDEPPSVIVSWPPAVAARYARLEKLGQGMFGDVHKAWDRAGQRFVAVKRLAGRTDDRFVKTGIREFAREAMSLAACRGHPSVVQLVATHADAARSDGDCFLVTAHAGGMNLRQYLALRRRQGRPFAEPEVRDAMRQLLAGVARAHAAGVLHRDVVPENVVVELAGAATEGRVRAAYRICGFGMSEPAVVADKDGSSMLASSAPYRAPELYLGFEGYDGRVDTWALGCIMAELLLGTGAPFFGAETDSKVLDKMLLLAGATDIAEWPGLERLATPRQVAAMREEARGQAGHLREVFPRKVLSREGFKVLKGLLCTHPERRLAADAALRKPWFRRSQFGSCFCGGGVASPSIAD